MTQFLVQIFNMKLYVKWFSLNYNIITSILNTMAQDKRASIHEIVMQDDDYKEFVSNQNYDILKKYNSDWKYGDVICVTNSENYGYRNDGKYMWDGENVIDLDYEHDDYGTVSSKFLVGKDFNTAMYWSDSIDHNSIVFAQFDTKYITDLKYEYPIISFKYNNVPWVIFTDKVIDITKTTVYSYFLVDYSCYFDNISDLYEMIENIVSKYDVNNVLIYVASHNA